MKKKKDGSVIEYMWVHRACADLCPQVFVDHMSHYCMVIEEVKRGRKIKCFLPQCGKRGATIGCLVGKCSNSVHVSCAVETGWGFAAGTSAYLCPEHRPKERARKEEERVESEVRAKWEEAQEKKRAKEEKKRLDEEAREQRRKELEESSVLRGARRSSRIKVVAKDQAEAAPLPASPMTLKIKGPKSKGPVKYCLCQIPETDDKGSFWLGCENCENWFHPKCVGLPVARAKKIAETGAAWLCPECDEEEGKFGLKKIQSQAPGSNQTEETGLGSPSKTTTIHLTV